MNDARFARTLKLFGRRGLECLSRARVVVVGLGAVGSYAVEGLARSGVGRLTVVDFDVIRSSNINRQLYALESTLGRSKAELARDRILDINPACVVDTVPCFMDRVSARDILNSKQDVLIDAIDSLGPKIELLTAGVHAGIQLVLSSMGAASRTDPSLIRVADIKETSACPLARFVRKRLKNRGIESGIRCVYSLEPAVAPAAESSELQDAQAQDGKFSRGRTRASLGSFACLTGIFGLILAREAIMEIVKPSID